MRLLDWTGETGLERAYAKRSVGHKREPAGGPELLGH